MNELVHIKGNDAFTDSLIIAEGTGNQHESIKRLITAYGKQFKELGTLPISNRKSTGGRPEQYFDLNEPQASFLMTLLKNNNKVVGFKLALVKEFYRMRQILVERSSSEWLQTRQKGKLTRRNETDVILAFINYAKEQGSKNAEKYYVHFTRLVNDAVGLKTGEREFATFKILSTIEMLEDMILHTVDELMQSKVYYRDIYQVCKQRVSDVMNYIYLPENRLLPTA